MDTGGRPDILSLRRKLNCPLTVGHGRADGHYPLNAFGLSRVQYLIRLRLEVFKMRVAVSINQIHGLAYFLAWTACFGNKEPGSGLITPVLKTAFIFSDVCGINGPSS